MVGKYLLCTHFRIIFIYDLICRVNTNLPFENRVTCFARIAAVTTTFDTRLMDMNIVLAHFIRYIQVLLKIRYAR